MAEVLKTTNSGFLTVRLITADHLADEAIGDLVEGLRKHDIWTSFALHEIRQRFRRSFLGPFWLTLSMGIMVGALGLVFSTLFGQDVSQTLPYIAVGLIFWGLLTAAINEGTTRRELADQGPGRSDEHIGNR